MTSEQFAELLSVLKALLAEAVESNRLHSIAIERRHGAPPEKRPQ